MEKGKREKKANNKREGSFGTRKLEMITHLLNLYSTLLGLRRKKKGEVFHSLFSFFSSFTFSSSFDNFLLFLKILSVFRYIAHISRFLSFILRSGASFIGLTMK